MLPHYGYVGVQGLYNAQGNHIVRREEFQMSLAGLGMRSTDGIEYADGSLGEQTKNGLDVVAVRAREIRGRNKDEKNRENRGGAGAVLTRSVRVIEKYG